MSSDWESACDPVPPRRELTDAQKRRLQALIELRQRQGFKRRRGANETASYRVDADFDEIGE